MPEQTEPQPPDDSTRTAAAALREATEALEAVAADRALLGTLSLEERARLLKAAATSSTPTSSPRRRYAKKKRKRARDAERRRGRVDARGDRASACCASRPVFTTPNVFPPKASSRRTRSTSEARRETIEEQHCYVCKQHYRRAPSLLRPALPAVRGVQLRQAHRDAPTSRGRVALLTGGRVKIGYQAGIKLLRAGAHLIVTTRFPRDSAARYAQEPDFADWGDRLEIFGLDLRHTPSVEAFCRAPAGDARPARLHRQQRLPDRAAPARLLRAHDGARDGGAARHARARAAAARRVRGAARLRHAARGRRRRATAARPSPIAGLDARGGAVAGAAAAGGARRRRRTSSPRAASTRTCSRSTCAAATPGGCCWPRCRRWSCSRCSSSTPSRRSSSTRGSSR